jgi:hypothetical protein
VRVRVRVRSRVEVGSVGRVKEGEMARVKV